MIWNLLAESTENAGTPQYMAYLALAFIAVLAVIFFVVNGRRSKQRQKEYEDELAAIMKGTKIKTIGGICGVVVELCPDNTVILETGSEESGRSYIKIDKLSIARTDLHIHDEEKKQDQKGESDSEGKEEQKSEIAEKPQPETETEKPQEKNSQPSEPVQPEN